MKVEWKAVANIVLAGDSRVYRGLSPTPFAETLGGRCVNFGFSSAGYTADYLDAVERVVSEKQGPPLVVLGVTPWSLTPRAAHANGFTEAERESRENQLPARWRRRVAMIEDALRPYEVERLWYGARLSDRYKSRAIEKNYRQEFGADGWVASDYLPHRPQRGVQTARADHAHNLCDPAVLAQLATRVRQWRTRGWRVVGFRPPAPDEVQRLADELSGYREDDVARAFTAAGAEWISLPGSEFETYDGAHLTAAAARRLSLQLAKTIKTSAPPALQR